MKCDYNRRSIIGNTFRMPPHKMLVRSYAKEPSASRRFPHKTEFEQQREEDERMSEMKEDWMERSGAYFVAFGEPARECLIEIAIPAFREHMPGVKIAVAGEKPLGCEDIFVEAPDSDIGGRLAKLHAYEWTPQEWEYIIYMDADTEVLASPAYLFRVLRDGWEFAICRHWGRRSIRRIQRFQKISDEEYRSTVKEIGTGRVMYYQAGVIAFRRTPAVRELFSRWVVEWKRWGAWDQAALARTIHACPLRLFLLAPHWNRRTEKNRIKGDTVIAHYLHQARRAIGKDWKRIGRFDAPEAWELVNDCEPGVCFNC